MNDYKVDRKDFLLGNYRGCIGMVCIGKQLN